MATFNIDAENSITALDSQQADFEGEIFANQKELADLAAKWPANRLIEVLERHSRPDARQEVH